MFTTWTAKNWTTFKRSSKILSPPKEHPRGMRQQTIKKEAWESLNRTWFFRVGATGF